MALKTKIWDASKLLTSDKQITAYLNAAIEDGDPAVVVAALGDIARAKGMSKIAREVGVSRESLYRSLSENGNPEFGTIVKVSECLGLGVKFTQLPKAKGKRTSALAQ